MTREHDATNQRDDLREVHGSGYQDINTEKVVQGTGRRVVTFALARASSTTKSPEQPNGAAVIRNAATAPTAALAFVGDLLFMSNIPIQYLPPNSDERNDREVLQNL
jgi:hypothetical protein